MRRMYVLHLLTTGTSKVEVAIAGCAAALSQGSPRVLAVQVTCSTAPTVAVTTRLPVGTTAVVSVPAVLLSEHPTVYCTSTVSCSIMHLVNVGRESAVSVFTLTHLIFYDLFFNLLLCYSRLASSRGTWVSLTLQQTRMSLQISCASR